MQDTNKEYCRILYDILLKKGVKHIILSPGSRNAPLLIGAACRPFKRRIITDERRAAFTALGIGMAANAPVALACTSGTAMYNYAPAVAEAFYQQIPLIIITADRPLEWIDQDDSQTLIQPQSLHNIVKGSFDIPVENPANPNEKWYVNRIVNEACNLALCGRKGPVHINIRFDNPLTGTIGYEVSNPRIVEVIEDLNLSPHLYKQLAGELVGKRILVTVGYMLPDDKLNRAIKEFSALPDVVVMCETLSNLHLLGNPYSVDSALSFIESDKTEIEQSLRPDVVISIGGSLVSRKLKEFIRRNPPVEHWTLADTPPYSDCFKCLTRHIEVSSDKFFKGITKHLKKYRSENNAQSYSRIWRQIRESALESHHKYLLEHTEWSELLAFNFILDNIPPSTNVFLSNGTPVRYGQLFTEHIPHASFGCRGVSGIDGTTATAAGCSIPYAGNTLLISGDMSMAYDTGVLGMDNLPAGFKIVVVNNEGGGIFRFIPSTRNYADREKLFCAAPNLPLEKLSETYGWKYFKAEKFDDLQQYFSEFINHNTNAILEIKVDKQLSADILVGYMNRN